MVDPATPVNPQDPPPTNRAVVGALAARESSARSYPRRLPVALVAGRGVEVTDVEGRTYLDCLAGAGALPLGHHHPKVDEALQRAIADGVPTTTLDLATPVKERFTESLFAVLPPHLRAGRIQFCGPTGADAVEAAIKLVRTATGRHDLVAFGGAYHGMTAGSLALTGAVAPKAPVGPLLPGVHHLPFPDARRCPMGIGGSASADACAHLVRWLLEDDHSGVPTPAAVVLEPVQGEGGVHPAPTRWATAVAAAARTHEVALVVDEVQTGLGRTGALWASDALGIEPDVLVLSKAIGGGLPLAVVVYREALDDWAPGAHAGTFRGNALAMVAGAATIEAVVAEDLPARAAAAGRRLLDGLQAVAAGDPRVGEVRGRGLMVGVELIDPHRTDWAGQPALDGDGARAVQQAMLERGVIVEVGGRGAAVVRFLPPLIITEAQVDRIVDAFAASLRATAAAHAA